MTPQGGRRQAERCPGRGGTGRGVVCDFGPSSGTGAGSNAQDLLELEFLKNEQQQHENP